MRKPKGATVHDWHHQLIEERVHFANRATGKLRKRETTKKAVWTITGHLRQCHHVSASRTASLEDLLAQHDELHKEDK